VDTSLFDIPIYAPLKLRGHVDHKSVWNGKKDMFDDRYIGLQSLALLAGIGYMFNTEFNQMYAMDRWTDARILAQPRVSTAQFVQDQEALYRAILSAFRLTNAAK
jgi:hypothetical protein